MSLTSYRAAPPRVKPCCLPTKTDGGLTHAQGGRRSVPSGGFLERRTRAGARGAGRMYQRRGTLERPANDLFENLWRLARRAGAPALSKRWRAGGLAESLRKGQHRSQSGQPGATHDGAVGEKREPARRARRLERRLERHLDDGLEAGFCRRVELCRGAPAASLAERLDRLSRLRAALAENEAGFDHAISADFGHRLRTETTIADLYPPCGARGARMEKPLRLMS